MTIASGGRNAVAKEGNCGSKQRGNEVANKGETRQGRRGKKDGEGGRNEVAKEGEVKWQMRGKTMQQRRQK